MRQSSAAILESIHGVALALWLCVLFGAGLGAAVAFPKMKELAPTIPSFAAYTGEHWRIAGGKVGMTLFWIVDQVQLPLAVLAVITVLGIAMARRGLEGRRLMVARVVIVLLATGIAGFHSLVLSPRMRAKMEDFWVAAKAGEMEKAASLQSAFDADHPTSRVTLESTALLLLAGVGAGVFHASRSRPAGTRGA